MVQKCKGTKYEIKKTDTQRTYTVSKFVQIDITKAFCEGDEGKNILKNYIVLQSAETRNPSHRINSVSTSISRLRISRFLLLSFAHAMYTGSSDTTMQPIILVLMVRTTRELFVDAISSQFVICYSFSFCFPIAFIRGSNSTSLAVERTAVEPSRQTPAKFGQ